MPTPAARAARSASRVISAADFLRAGACCLGVGGQLVEPKAVAEGNFDRIRDLARQYTAVVREVRRT